MARTSLTTARSAAGGRRRRAKAPGVVKTAAGATEPVNRADTTSSAEPNAPHLLGADALPQASETAADTATACAAEPAPTGLRRWLARARALGLTVPELVSELHLRLGLPLLEVAHILSLGLDAVRAHWLLGRSARAALAPQSEADFALLREHLSEVLWQTVHATYPDVLADADDADADPPPPATPPMLSVRLKALDQIAKLYDLSLEQRATDGGPLPYATPEEIAESVRERVLEMHLRAE
ncbi:MAG: hypothetical protein B7Z37_21120 [Verrucomicrobia bacterium 12-59-8]|nr:MAG: hypothetical protein B7Z37_21120 [Verrucomicrobia bacterium 12-59-8]